MYNKYMQADENLFSELYRPIEDEEQKKTEEVISKEENVPKKKFDLKRLLNGLDVNGLGVLPIVLLLLLLLDVDDEEKMIIVALAIIFGI